MYNHDIHIIYIYKGNPLTQEQHNLWFSSLPYALTSFLLPCVCSLPLWKPVVSPILLTIFFHIVAFLTKKWSTCPSLGLVTGRTTLIPSRMGESELHLLLRIPWTQTQCSPLARGIISLISSNYQRLYPSPFAATGPRFSACDTLRRNRR